MTIVHVFLVVGCLVILVPGSEGIGNEENSPIKARGQTPTCPAGESPKYEIPMPYIFPKYCVNESPHCNLNQRMKEGTYFYVGFKHCNQHSYVLVVLQHHGWYEQRFFLDTLTVATNPFPSLQQLASSVFPVYRSYESPEIFYKMEDKICYRITYSIQNNPRIKYNKKFNDDDMSDACKALEVDLGEFFNISPQKNWYTVHMCASLEKPPEKVECSEIKTLKKIPLH